jgi:hypothetical protein
MKRIALAALLTLFPFFLRAEGPAGPGATPGPVTTDAEIIADLNLDFPGLEKVKAAVAANDLPAAEQAYLDYRRNGSPARWKVMPADEPPAAVEKTDLRGDEVCSHRIPNITYSSVVLPAKSVAMGEDFDWTHNPLPHDDPSFTQEWTYVSVSRVPFWRDLADAYWKTRDEKYAVEWVKELQDFAAKNPMPPTATGAGMWGDQPAETHPTLWLALDCGIRMSDSYPYAYYHFLDSPSFTPAAQWLYLKLVQENGDRLRSGLVNPDRSGNHVTTESFALYTIAVLFPELKEAPAWRTFAMDRLQREIERVVPPDGFEAELTPGYHLVAVNGFRGPLELAELNHLPVPAEFRTKILSMYRALVLVMDQSGNDVPTNDSWPINAIGAARKGLQLGDDPLLEWAASKGQKGIAPPDSTALPYAGFYAMRGGWKPDDLFLFFRAGPPGLGHEHQDMLEVVLRAWNQTLLFDPGTYSYDHSDWRRFTIDTDSHSTITVDGRQQHRPPNPVPVVEPMRNPWITTPLFDYAAGTYDQGYQQSVYDSTREYHPEKWVGPLDKSVSHTRRVLFLRPYYALVLDTLDGTGDHLFEAHFQMDATSARVDPATQAIFSQRPGDEQLALYSLDRDHLQADVVQGQKDPLLGWLPGKQQATPAARLRKQQAAPAIFATFLYPYQGEAAPAFAAQLLAVQGDGVWGESLQTPREKAEIAIVKKNVAQPFSFASGLLGPVQAEAATLVVRQPVGRTEVFAGGWNIRSYHDGKVAFTAAQPSSLVWVGGLPSLLVYNAGAESATLSITRPFSLSTALVPGQWTRISASGAERATEPLLFDPLP